MPVQPHEPPYSLNPLEQDKGLIGVESLAAEELLLQDQRTHILQHELAEEDDPGAAEGVAKRKLGIPFWIAAGWIIGLSALAFLSFLDLLPIADPNLQPTGIDAISEQSLPPLSTRLDGSLAVLGTDHLGRDQLSRVIYGAQVSLFVGFTSVFIGVLVGGTLGLMSGYFRGKVDTASMAGMDILLAFPPLLLALAIVAIRGKGVPNAILALTIVSIPTIARLVRANTLVYSKREFVTASRTMGASHSRVMGKEVLPNVLLALLPFIPLGIAVAIAAEGALAYLGQSVEPPTASWGVMINEGRPELYEGNWWVPMVAIVFLVLTLISLNLIGDRLRVYFALKEGSL